MPAVHPQDFSVMAVLQPQKVIHDSFHLRPMRSENEFLRILSLGPPTGSKPLVEAIWVIVLVYSPFGSWRARSRLLGIWAASSRLSPLVHLATNGVRGNRPLCIIIGSDPSQHPTACLDRDCFRIARNTGAIHFPRSRKVQSPHASDSRNLVEPVRDRHTDWCTGARSCDQSSAECPGARSATMQRR
jgi:hypothetical protein